MSSGLPVDRLRIASASPSPTEATLALDGELDLVTAPLLRDEIARHRAEGQRVTVDLAKVTFLDSTGLTLLMEEARADGGIVLRREVGAAVARLLEITRTEQLFTWADGDGDAAPPR
jgi:anti-sigma B factor antagonist